MTAKPPSGTRAERRAAQRQQRVRQRETPQSKFRLSVGQLSIIAAVAGIALVAFLALANSFGSSGGGPIKSPDVAIPSDLMNGRSIGDANAPLTIDEWADFQCPVCRQFYETIDAPLISTYIQTGKVRLVFHDYAFIGPASTTAAAAARVSAAIGPGFWPFYDYLYTNQGTENGDAFSQSRLADMAVALGMDRTAFLNALADSTYTNAVKAETNQGQQLGVSSTPTLVINGQLYPGLPTWTQLSTLIDQLSPSPSPSSSP